jgi:hypothetical protein
MSKKEILERFSAEENRITFSGEGNMSFPVAWQWNEVPTKTEWDKMSLDSLFLVEARIGNLVSGGRIATIIPVKILRESPVNV